MAIKKLQNDYTTPEQSKRLLELGVPADSADCYIRLDFNVTESPDIIRYHATFSEIKKRNEIIDKNFIPCWSVGRLMEIFDMCYIYEQTDDWCSYHKLHENQTYTDYILFVFSVNKMRGLLDFSKLEE